MIQIEHATTLSQFAELRSTWNRLAGALPTQSWEWLYSWSETMLTQGSLMLLVGRNEDQQVIGIAPFYRNQHWVRGDMIRFLGDGQTCTDYSTFLIEPGSEDSFVDAVANWLLGHSSRCALPDPDNLDAESDDWLGWDLICLQGIAQSDKSVARFGEAMARENCHVNTKQDYSCWQVAMPESWDEYVASLSKSQRRNVRRVTKRVLENDDFQVKLAHDGPSLKFAMQHLERLHQKRWVQAGEVGCFSVQHFTEFLNVAATRLFAKDQIRLLWIEHHGEPVAVDFSFQTPNASYGYQTGIDPEYFDHEIGRCLMTAAMRATHQAQRQIFDFMRGDEQYKSRWRATEVPLVDLEVVPDRSLPLFRKNLVQFGRRVKRKLSKNVSE